MIKSFSNKKLSKLSSFQINKLLEALSKEMNTLNKHSKDDSQYVYNFLTSKQFKLNENEESRRMTLVKTNNENKIEINFLSTSMFNDKRLLITRPNIRMDFNVLIEKSKKEKQMVFECWSMLKDTKYSILSIFSFNKDTKPLYPFSSNVTCFDIGMKKGFQHYLLQKGITKDIVRCIKYLALDKEQRLYKNWVKDISSLL